MIDWFLINKAQRTSYSLHLRFVQCIVNHAKMKAENGPTRHCTSFGNERNATRQILIIRISSTMPRYKEQNTFQILCEIPWIWKIRMQTVGESSPLSWRSSRGWTQTGPGTSEHICVREKKHETSDTLGISLNACANIASVKLILIMYFSRTVFICQYPSKQRTYSASNFSVMRSTVISRSCFSLSLFQIGKNNETLRFVVCLLFRDIKSSATVECSSFSEFGKQNLVRRSQSLSTLRYRERKLCFFVNPHTLKSGATVP